MFSEQKLVWKTIVGKLMAFAHKQQWTEMTREQQKLETTELIKYLAREVLDDTEVLSDVSVMRKLYGELKSEFELQTQKLKDITDKFMQLSLSVSNQLKEVHLLKAQEIILRQSKRIKECQPNLLNLVFPSKASIQNYLTGISDNDRCEYSFCFGSKGGSNSVSQHTLTYHSIPADLSKIKAFYAPSNSLLMGLQMWDREGNIVFQSRDEWVFTDPFWKSVETVLEEGERIVGIKSYQKDKDNAYHQYLQFVIGK